MFLKKLLNKGYGNVKINTIFKNKKLFLFLIIIIIALSFCLRGCPQTETLISFCFRGFPQKQSEYYKKYNDVSDCFGPAKIKFSTIAYKCTDKEKTEVKSVMDTFKKVLAYTGTKADADINVGSLEKFYYFSDEWNYASTKYDAKLITAKQSGSNGYIWVVYSVEHYEKNGKIHNGSWDVPCYFKIKKINDKWTVVDVIKPS
ncbi:hypothetical protein EOL94_04075 [bacterium]|nr:hypothetical protein [bacterium]